MTNVCGMLDDDDVIRIEIRWPIFTPFVERQNLVNISNDQVKCFYIFHSLSPVRCCVYSFFFFLFSRSTSSNHNFALIWTSDFSSSYFNTYIHIHFTLVRCHRKTISISFKLIDIYLNKNDSWLFVHVVIPFDILFFLSFFSFRFSCSLSFSVFHWTTVQLFWVSWFRIFSPSFSFSCCISVAADVVDVVVPFTTIGNVIFFFWIFRCCF